MTTPQSSTMAIDSKLEEPFTIAIIGGGITGLTLAIALLNRHIPVTIYEQAPRFGEIGAGVAFGPNAVQAMKRCSPEVYDAFEKVATKNQWKSKEKVWFDWVDGFNHSGKDEGDGKEGKEERFLFKVENVVGANSVHRAHFLDELVKLVPEGVSKFGKHLDNVEDDGKGKLLMKFNDGSTATADAGIPL